MTLQDLENLILSTMQQSNPAPNFGGAPAWSTANNAQFPQTLVDFEINEGYRQLLSDTSDLHLTTITVQFFSTTNTYAYPVRQTNMPEVLDLWRVFYQPVGLPYATEFRQGTEFVSWETYQRVTGQGYLTPYSYGTQPQICAVYPDRKNLAFYPGSANAGDLITYYYVPLPTPGTVLCPTLELPTDVPITPSDTHRAIAYKALSELWMKAREAATADMYLKRYEKMIADIRRKYELLSGGDTRTIERFSDNLSIGTLLP